MCLHVIHPETPLIEAYSLLLEFNISVLPVVDSYGVLLDIYTRTDVIQLVKGNIYTKLQYENLDIQQALTMARAPTPPLPPLPTTKASYLSSAIGRGGASTSSGPIGGLSSSFHESHGGITTTSGLSSSSSSGTSIPHPPHYFNQYQMMKNELMTKMYTVTRQDTLRTVVEHLAMPGVRRLIVIEPNHRTLEGIISLTDVAQYLLLS